MDSSACMDNSNCWRACVGANCNCVTCRVVGTLWSAGGALAERCSCPADRLVFAWSASSKMEMATPSCTGPTSTPGRGCLATAPKQRCLTPCTHGAPHNIAGWRRPCCSRA
jgi:hypothetical protein